MTARPWRGPKALMTGCRLRVLDAAAQGGRKYDTYDYQWYAGVEVRLDEDTGGEGDGPGAAMPRAT